VALAAKYVPHFKPGKELRERVNVYGRDDGMPIEPISNESDAEPAGGGGLF